MPCQFILERVYLPQHKEQTYKNILNKSTVAGYQKGKPMIGYLTEDQKQMLQRVLYRANRRGFTSQCHDLDTLAESAQHDLFHHSRHSAHCLNHLYTARLKPLGAMRLRARGHDYELPTVKFEFNKRNFIVRSLFQYV